MNAIRLLILVAATAFVLVGCKTTTEPENTSERPWNAQKGWEHGLPTGINQGR